MKTKNGKREIDLHSSVAAMLKDFIGERDQGLLFQSRKGKPLSQSKYLAAVAAPDLGCPQAAKVWGRCLPQIP